MTVKISVLTPTIRGKQGLVRPRNSLTKQTMKQFEWLIEKHEPSDPPDFNKAMNRMLKVARGELIVILQDFIKIPEDGLKRFWDAYERTLNVCFTAPVGKERKDSVEWDWRKGKSEKENLNFAEWEIDWACAPKLALFKAGGFDEELDQYWGFDNVNIGLRLVNEGYIIRNLSSNPAVAFDHDSVLEHPYRKLRNPMFHNERLQDIRQGLKINYLEI